MLPRQQTINAGISGAVAAGGHLRFVGGWGSVLSWVVALGSVMLLQDSCAAGIIFPAAAGVLTEQFQTNDESQSLVVEQESGVGSRESRDPADKEVPSSLIGLPSHTAANTSGCGTPTVPSSGTSSGSLAAWNGTVLVGSRAPDRCGAVVTEINLALPTLAPSELLDPPRVAG